MAHSKADTVKRVAAVLIDALIAALIYLLLSILFVFLQGLGYLLATAAAAAFLLFRDAIPIGDLKGASPGKRILGLRAIQGNGSLCDFTASAKRNLTVAAGWLVHGAFLLLGLIFSFIPFVKVILDVANVLTGIVVLLALVMELVKVVSDEHGIRLGDLLADTIVIEANTPPDPKEVDASA